MPENCIKSIHYCDMRTSHGRCLVHNDLPCIHEAAPTPPVSPSNSSDLLSELNSCKTLLASGVDIEPLMDGKPRYKVVLTGPEDLMTRFFNELIRGRGKRT